MKKSIKENKKMRMRIVIIGVIFFVLYTAIGARATYFQLFCKSWLPQRAAAQYEKSYTFREKRGTIYDRKHRELAVTIDVSSIAAHPVNVKDPKKSAKDLSRILEIDNDTLLKQLSSRKSFVWIKRRISSKDAGAVKDLNIAGVELLTEHSRIYPNKILAAQVLGFSGTDHNGLEGLEFFYDTNLKGRVVTHRVIKDALGRGFKTENNSFKADSGNNLILTIDQTIQYITERALKETALEYSAKSAMAIVMDPKTGAIRALAHFPSFNSNSFQDFDRETWRNRAITDLFEPGSTMKIFLAAAAIESGKCSESTIFYCEGGKYKVDRNYVHDTHPHQWLSLQQIVKYSSNIGAVKVTEKMGAERLYDTLKSFGFGSKTGIDCPGETKGSLSSYKIWSKIDAGAISFGQGISVSAIQLITAVSAIANGGIIMKPYIVQAITDENGRLVKAFAPTKVRTAISADTAARVKKIMGTVTTEKGTGVNAALESYPVCGKTGTAQKIDQTGRYSKDKYIASFVGFAPEEDPRIAILIVIDEPKNNHYGGIVAAPVFKKVAQETFNYINVQEQNQDEWRELDTLMTSYSIGENI
jgi:cell division protein FtsI (penicillin-binding protein 3)